MYVWIKRGVRSNPPNPPWLRACTCYLPPVKQAFPVEMSPMKGSNGNSAYLQYKLSAQLLNTYPEPGLLALHASLVLKPSTRRVSGKPGHRRTRTRTRTRIRTRVRTRTRPYGQEMVVTVNRKWSSGCTH